MGHKKNIPIDVSRGKESRKKGELRGLRSVLPRSSSGSMALLRCAGPGHRPGRPRL
jgi:hypothetical protein